MPKQKMTLDKLAGMMQNQFSNLQKEVKGLRIEIKDVKTDTSQIIRQQIAEVERDDRQDLKIKNHEERIVVLEKEKEIV